MNYGDVTNSPHDGGYQSLVAEEKTGKTSPHLAKGSRATLEPTLLMEVALYLERDGLTRTSGRIKFVENQSQVVQA